LLQESKGSLNRDIAKRVRTATYYGDDLVARPRRLALMNLYLHQVQPHIGGNDSIYDPPGPERFDVVLTNPPFGTRGANQAPARDDFVIETSNKQLNFIQHVMTILKPGGRAAVVVPDNVLFSDQAGDVFKVLMEDCDLHTVLRLPRGTFSPYSPGTKTNVLFFTKGRPTDAVWIYDARANVPAITKKDRPLAAAHFAEFEACYGADPFGRAKRVSTTSKGDRWREFGLAQVKDRQYNLDGLKWLKDEEGDTGEDIAEPTAYLEAAMTDLNAAMRELTTMQDEIEAMMTRV
jgi:type I restriction enzyme M protein